MKKYFANYYNGFGNAYDLRWADTAEDVAALIEWGYERVSRKEAERLCAAERWRRKYDQAFSGYADTHIWPAALDRDYFDSFYPERGYVVDI